MSVLNVEKELTRARLLPSNNIKNAEARLTSITLAVFQSIPEFAQRMLNTVGVRVGQRSSVRSYIEPELNRNRKTNKSEDRPDGLIVHQNGKNLWLAVIEAKINNAEIKADQVKRYIQLATASILPIDAIITISNQFVAVPSHHPLKSLLDKRRKIKLYHWSWTNIETQAVLLLEDPDFQQREKRYILREFIHFLQSESSGVTKFNSMHKDWAEMIKQARTEGVKIPKNEVTENAVGSWHQECRDIVLMLARELKQPVTLQLRRDHINDPSKRLDDDIKLLIEKSTLVASINVHHAASDICITANVQSKVVTLSMDLKAPQDIPTYKGRIGWLTRQLKDQHDKPIDIYIYGKRKTQMLCERLSEILDKDNHDFWGEAKKLEPTRFEVKWQADFSKEFSQSRGFIVKLEELMLMFYKSVGENLQQYQPAPPRIKKADVELNIEEDLTEE